MTKTARKNDGKGDILKYTIKSGFLITNLIKYIAFINDNLDLKVQLLPLMFDLFELITNSSQIMCCA